jgi:hypothetical protein
MPQKLFISRGSFTNVLGSLGFVCGTAADELPVEEGELPLLLPLLPLVEDRLLP